MRDSDDLQAQILRAYGLKPWDIGAGKIPWRVRIWRTATLAYRRGKAIDWSQYNEAEAEARAREEEFHAALADHARDIAERLSDMLPEGLRFEWQEPSEPD